MTAAMFSRIFLALSLCLVAMPAGARTPDPGARYDQAIADAKGSMMTDPATTVSYARTAQLTAERMIGERRAVAIATSKWLQAEAYLRLNNLQAAGPLLREAETLATHQGRPDKLNGDILLSKGTYNTALGRVADALASYQKSFKIYQSVNDVRSQSVALVFIATLYLEAEDRKNGIRYLNQALDIYSGDPQLLFSIHGNRAIVLGELNKFLQAQAEFSKTLSIAKSLHSPMLIARTLRNLARAQLDAGQLAAADRSIAQGSRVAAGDDSGATTKQFLILSARSALLHKRLAPAQRLIARAFDGVDLQKTTIEFREGHLTAYTIYKQAGNEPRALVHLEALKRLEDETSKLAASANTALATARFDFANQELNLEKLKRAQLQHDIDDAKLRARTQQTVFVIFSIATVLIVGLLAFGLVTFRRSRDEVRAANVDLERTNAALEKALAAKTEFLATTSHEIRTPLNGILGMTQVMLADPTLAAPVRDRLGVVHGAGVTMRALVDDILDVAKMETGKLSIEQAPVELAALLTDVSRLWEEQARGKGIRFTLDLAECPAWVLGDAARLRQIAFNLLSNAMKFTDRGAVAFRARPTGTPSAPTIEVSVSDSGVGIPADKLDLIFESFRQADAGTTRRFGGTGLGLAICRNLARAMGGDVTVVSTPGAGSVFTLTLPFVPAAAPAVEAPTAATRALLIVDRNPIARAMLRAVLEPHAEAVVFAATPADAVAVIQGGGVARVVIDDATLGAAPDPGAALAALTAASDRVALLWTAPTPDDRARLSAAGVERVVAKPIASAALVGALFDDAPRDDLAPPHLATRAA